MEETSLVLFGPLLDVFTGCHDSRGSGSAIYGGGFHCRLEWRAALPACKRRLNGRARAWLANALDAILFRHACLRSVLVALLLLYLPRLNETVAEKT